MSINGAKHYDLKINSEKIKLVKYDKNIILKDNIILGKEHIKIFNPGFPIFWDVSV